MASSLNAPSLHHHAVRHTSDFANLAKDDPSSSDTTIPKQSLYGRLRSLLATSKGRYVGVSVVSVGLTEVCLLLFTLAGAEPVVASIAASSLAAVVAFLLYRFWVWPLSKVKLWKQIFGFSGVTFLGVSFSTFCVYLASHFFDNPFILVAANLAGFTVLWVLRFLLFDRLLFAK